MLYLGMNKRNNQNQQGVGSIKMALRDFVKVNVNQKRRCKMVKVKEVKKTEVVKVKQVVKKLTNASIKLMNPKDLDNDYSYQKAVSSKKTLTFLTEKGYPVSNGNKKTKILYLDFNNKLDGKTLRDFDLSFRPDKKSHNLFKFLGYEITDIKKKKNGGIVDGKIVKK